MQRAEANRVYLGNLPPDIRVRDVEDFVMKYGRIINVDLKSQGGSPFAFVEFEDPRDAADCVYGRNGVDLEGYRIRVEYTRGRKRHRWLGHQRGDVGFRRSTERPSGAVRRSMYRVNVAGLPASASWQDLKDFMRGCGEVCFADVFKDGTGLVEFLSYDDMKYAVKKLDDTKFKSHGGETSYVTLKEEFDKRGRSRSRSRGRRSRSRSRSSSRTSVKTRTRSMSRSRSRSRSRR